MDNNSLVPRLRFKEFSGEWEEKKVSEIFEVTRGRVLAMKLMEDKPSIDNPYPVYSSQTKDNGLAGYYNDYLYKDAITWTTDGANAGEVNYRKGKFYCTNVCGVLLNTDGYANKCIAELLNSVSKQHVSYVGNPKLMNNVMSEINIPIPSLEEQHKIAEFITSLDTLIKSEQTNLEQLIEHKKGLMQNLFPQEGETMPKVRFKEFENDGEWEEMKIEDVFESFSGGTPTTSKKQYYGGNIPFIRSAEIDKAKTELFLTEEGLENSSAKLVAKGDLLVALYGANSGDSAISKIDGAINQAILCLQSGYSNNYVYNYLTLRKEQIVSKYIQGGQGNLSGNIIKSITLPFPSEDEQQKIANTLSSLDNLIASQTERIELLHQHKKGLMQNLFPSTE